MFQRKPQVSPAAEFSTGQSPARPAVDFPLRPVPGRAIEPRLSPPLAPERPSNGRTLAVGRGITLAGAIASCETLVVEGNVESTSFDGRALEIAEGGAFKGNAKVESARIAGRFEGELLARERLVLAPTARVSGRISYARLEIAQGGEIAGEIAVLPGAVAD